MYKDLVLMDDAIEWVEVVEQEDLQLPTHHRKKNTKENTKFCFKLFAKNNNSLSK
jgi:hypothetical protein